ncbi:MAG: hypothetical protein ACRDJN_23525, partial [Chloroflexota bacterium]
MVRRTVIWVDYKNRSEAWWQALWTRLEEDPQAVPAPLRQLTRPNGSDRIEVTPAEARNVLEWAATLP